MIKRSTGLCAALVLAAALLAGCTSLPAPKTPKQTLAYTETSYTAAVQTLTDLKKQHVLTNKQTQRANQLIQTGNTDLAAAHAALSDHDTATLQGKLGAVDSVLAKLRTMIQRQSHE